ncbi:hypothetical protein ACFV1B_20270 [Streptomyces sp. NPDC059637]|uniref:hypothetical protein n=1 Tax=Streptomyces TaxID=1883 RepID=UPI0031E19998
MSMSLDGFIAPDSLGDLMGQQWMELQQWIFPQRFFRENLKLGEGVDAGRVALEQVRAEPSPRVTHVTYAVRER